MGDSAQDIVNAINILTKRKQLEVFTSLPCKIKSVDYDKQTVTIDICVKAVAFDNLKRKYYLTNYPSMDNIPIFNNPIAKIKVSEGDYGTYLILYSNLDSFLEGNIPADVNFSTHELTNGIYLPYGYNPQQIYNLQDGVGYEINTGADKVLITNDTNKTVKDILESITDLQNNSRDAIMDFILQKILIPLSTALCPPGGTLQIPTDLGFAQAIIDIQMFKTEDSDIEVINNDIEGLLK